jgi:hypothetical protein
MSSSEAAAAAEPETTITLLKREPGSMQRSHLQRVLGRIDDECIDLVGLRLVYPDWKQAAAIGDAATFAPRAGKASLVLGLRAIGARERWLAAVGPEDPFVARQTDPRSLRALLGTSREENLLACDRGGSGWGKHALPLYFGGRVTPAPRDPAEALDVAAAGGSPALLPALVPLMESTAMLLLTPSPPSAMQACLHAAVSRGFAVRGFGRLDGLTADEVSLKRLPDESPWLQFTGECQRF